MTNRLDRLINRIRPFFKEAVIVGFGQVMSLVITFAGIRLLTELMTPYHYGLLALFLSIFQFGQLTMFGPYSQGTLRFYSYAREKGQLQLLESITRKKFMRFAAITMLTFTGIFFLSKVVSFFSNLQIITIVILGAYTVSSGLESTFLGILNAARRRVASILHSTAGKILHFGLAALLIYFFTNDSLLALLAYTISSVTIIFFLYRYYRRVIYPYEKESVPATPEQRESFIGKLNNYYIPFSIWGIAYWLQIGSERWALEFFASTDEVGLYNVIYQVGFQPGYMGVGLLTAFLGPIFFEKAGSGEEKNKLAKVRMYNNYFVMGLSGVFLVAIVIAYYFHEYIFGFLVARDFRSISYMLPVCLAAGAFFGTSQLLVLNLLSAFQTRKLMIIQITTSIIGIILNFTLAKFYAAEGVVFALLFTYFTYFFLLLINREVNE